MPFGLGIGEILLIVALVVVIFGAKRIPLIARGLGAGIRNFKGSLKAPEEEEEDARAPGTDDSPPD